jgi:hypothetical protein
MLFAIKGNRDNAPELDGGVIVDARPDLDEYNRKYGDHGYERLVVLKMADD